VNLDVKTVLGYPSASSQRLSDLSARIMAKGTIVAWCPGKEDHCYPILPGQMVSTSGISN
jgi:hypothetical protein